MKRPLIFLCIAVLTVSAQSVGSMNGCSGLVNCSTCIQSTQSCVWCYSGNTTSGASCLPASERDSCEYSRIEDPVGSVTPLQNLELSETVLVSPQKVMVNLRPGSPESFTLEVRPAGDYPLDVYFLMDFSASMGDDLNSVKNLADTIADTIGSITGDFRIGFGSFIEKYTDPFLRVSGSYSFKHILSMTNSADDFTNAVKDERTFGNNDRPEGGFDGLLQVIKCRELIGWRNNSRHILVYITDAEYHIGYDGILAGAVRPNQGECLMPQDSTPPVYYDLELSASIDYPSVSQIYSLLVEYDIIPILCANRVLPLYERLAAVIPGATAAALSSNADNIVQIIQDEYRKISQRVQVSVDAVPGLKVNIEAASCPTPNENDPAICEDVQINEKVEFNVSLEIAEITKEILNLERLDIRVVFFGNVEVLLDVLLDCSCDNNVSRGPEICFGGGKLACGLCQCDTGRVGKDCFCNSTGNEINQNCPVGVNDLECSGKGECICGRCLCDSLNEDEYYFGRACECNNFNCPIDELGRRCSGQGTCGCAGMCICDISPLSSLPYTGELCQCSPDTDSCKDPSDIGNRLCNGVGECECNQCVCENGFTGDFCELCNSESSCSSQNCQLFSEECISCLVSVVNEKVVITSNKCSASCPNITLIGRDLTAEEDESTFSCIANVEGDNCNGNILFFVPQDSSQRNTVLVRESPGSCAVNVNANTPAYIIAIPIVVGMLVIGILTIIITKLILMYLDWREYKHFKKEVAGTQFYVGGNPLYKKASQEIDNPLYTMINTEAQ